MWRGAAGAMAGARAIMLLPEGYDSGGLPAGTLLLRGGHPHPTAGSFESTRRILAEVDRLGAGDRLLVLLSGGASALLEAPAEGITEEEVLAAHRSLVASGRDIASINAARSRLSAVKGGRLADRAHPASVTTLAISDVEGDSPEVIGSAPTVKMGTGTIFGKPTGSDPGERKIVPVPNFWVVAGVGDAVAGARGELERRGYRAQALGSYLAGTTAGAAGLLASMLEGLEGRRGLVAGGETTVAVTSPRPGVGGRNLDLAARLALAIRGRRGIAILVGGTDGRDGSSRAAGALVDGGTAARAEAAGLGLEPALEAFDTESALEAAGDLHVTGPTGTNVGDLVVAVLA